MVFAVVTFKSLWVNFFSKKILKMFLKLWSVCFDVKKCKFIVKKQHLKMLVVFSPIFVAGTKRICVYNCVASLMKISIPILNKLKGLL